MTEQISLQKDDRQAALAALTRLEDILGEAYIGTEINKIRAALTAQLTKTDDNVSCPSVANAGDINAELLEALKDAGIRIIAAGVVIPDGYALVPKKILESLHQKPVYGNYDYQCGYLDCLKDAKAMLSAAPQPPKNGD